MQIRAATLDDVERLAAFMGRFSLVGQGSIRRTFRAGNRRSDVAVDAHHATCISVYGIAVDLVLDPPFFCWRYRTRAAEQLHQPITAHEGNNLNGVVIRQGATALRKNGR